MSRWKQGDTSPDLVIDCFDGTGVRAPLEEATQVKVIVTRKGQVEWERVVTDVANGTVTVPLQATDVDTPGTFFVKVFAQWGNGTRQHYPPADEYMEFTVTR